MDPGPTFAPSEKVLLRAGDHTLVFTIDTPCAPFTQSAVLVARSPELGPQPVIVKIYDPKILNARLPRGKSPPSHPWSLEAERAGAAVGDKFLEGENSLYPRPPQPGEDAEGLAKRAALWERYYQGVARDAFLSERTAYARLAPFQGSAIPRLLLVGTYLPPDEWFVHLPALVLEFIPDAVDVSHVDPATLEPEVCATLLRAVDHFASYGVLHADPRDDHLLFSPHTRPTRAVIIDFGEAQLKEEGEDEDDWSAGVAFYRDSFHTRDMLWARGVRGGGVEIDKPSSEPSSEDSSEDSSE